MTDVLRPHTPKCQCYGGSGTALVGEHYPYCPLYRRASEDTPEGDANAGADTGAGIEPTKRETYKWPQVEMEWWADSGGYWVARWKGFGGLMADGPTREEAFARLLEVIQDFLPMLAEEGAALRTSAVRGDEKGAAVGGWRSIESAPLDGTEVAVICGDDTLWIARWVEGPICDGRHGWEESAGGVLVKPTHWMPLPASPTDSSVPEERAVERGQEERAVDEFERAARFHDWCGIHNPAEELRAKVELETARGALLAALCSGPAPVRWTPEILYDLAQWLDDWEASPPAYPIIGGHEYAAGYLVRLIAKELEAVRIPASDQP